MSSKFYYDDITLDRAHHLRMDENWLSTGLNGDTVHVIPVWRNQSLIVTNNLVNSSPNAAILMGSAADNVRKNAETLVFLGIKDDIIYCAADLSHIENPHSNILPKETSFEDLRQMATTLDPIEAGYLAYARALIHWHQGHQFCGSCGNQTKSSRGGHERACLNSECGKSHFPRTDPAVIMLVTHPTEDKCLLGHNKKFQGLRFSTIAGFVEPGEMLEQAVAREVFEETNIQVVEVTYKASQPWPFPASIMLGFRARAITTEIICHDEELTEARWFSRAEVIKMATTHEMLPPANLSISRWLIDCWLSEN
jgi:NAD+ diphosphatase